MLAYDLEIGDTVYFEANWPGSSSVGERFGGSESLLCCDGFASEDLRLVTVEDWTKDATQDIRDCLFQVVTKLNYGAAADFRRHGVSKSRSRNDMHMQQLYARYKVEQKENEQLLRKTGDNVEYGMVLQFLHIKSKKYLTLVKDESAQHQKESRRVRCIETGTDGSKFHIHSFYKGVRSNGESVTPGDVVELVSFELGNPWMLHFAKDALPRENADAEPMSEEREVNICMLDENLHGWKIRLYSRTPLCASELDSRVSMASRAWPLGYGSVITLRMPHHEGYLALSSRPHREDGSRKRPELMPNGSSELLGYATSSRCLWVLERPRKTEGRSVAWSDELCLRHLGSSTYLGVEHISDDIEESRVVSVDFCDPERCIFRLQDLSDDGSGNSSESQFVPAHKARFFLRCEKNGQCGYLHCGDKIAGDGELDDGGWSSSCIYGLGLRRDVPESDSFLCELPPGEVVQLAEEAVSLRNTLRQTLQTCIHVAAEMRSERRMRPSRTSASAAGERHGRREGSRQEALESIIRYDALFNKQQELLFRLKLTLCRCLKYLSKGPDQPAAEGMEEMVAEAQASLRHPANDLAKLGTMDEEEEADEELQMLKPRQRAFRELKCIDAIVSVLDGLWEVYPLTSRTSKADISMMNAGDEDAEDSDDENVGVASEDMSRPGSPHRVAHDTKRIYCLIFRVLRYAFLNNRESELYIDKSGCLQKIVERTAYGVGAERCFAALITNNSELLEKIEMDIVAKFVDLIKDLGCDPDFLKMMQSCCSCTGMGGIISKQELCLRVLYNPGDRAEEEEALAFKRNRRQLLLTFATDAPAFNSPHQRGKQPEPHSCKAFPELDADLLAVARHGNFQGLPLFQAGILPKVVIAWNYSDDRHHNWGLDQEFLYHSPQALGLEVVPGIVDSYGREVVTLSDLSKDLYEEEQKLNDNGPGDAVVRQRSNLDKLKAHARELLARYCTQQLALFSEMALDRSMNVIESLEKEFSFELCICGLFDETLPNTMRANFATLISRLYVDRQPHMNLNLPSSVMALGTSVSDVLPHFGAGMSDHTTDFDESTETKITPTANKFMLLEFFIRQHFKGLHGRQILEAHGQNLLTRALLEIVVGLVTFGFLPTVSRLHSVCKPIIEVMDGRPDRPCAKGGPGHQEYIVTEVVYDPVNSFQAGSNTSKKLAQVVPEVGGDPKALGTPREESGVGSASNHRAPLQALQSTAWTDIGTGQVPPSRESTGSSTSDSEEGERDRVVDVFAGISGFASPSDRYGTSAHGAMTVIACKAKMAEIGADVLRAGTDHMLSRLLSIFEANRAILVKPRENTQPSLTWEVPGQVTLTRQVVQEVVQTIANDVEFSMTRISGLHFPTICMDLSMYQSEELFRAAFHLLYMSCLRFKITLDHALGVRLLTRTDPRLKWQVVRLEQLITSYEQWGIDNHFSPIGEKEKEECFDLLLRLRRKLSQHGPEVDSDAPDEQAQEVLAAFGIQRVLLQAFSISVPPGKESADILCRVLESCCQLLAMLCRGSERNQRSLFGHLDVLHKWRKKVPVDIVIAEVFRENVGLCEKLPKNLIMILARAMRQENGTTMAKLRMMETLLSCLAVNDRPVLRVKQMLLEVLNDRHLQEAMLLIYKDNHGFDRRTALLKGFRSDDELDQPLEFFRRYASDEDVELVYHLRSMELLIVLSHGRDPLSEASVQSIVSVTDVAKAYFTLCIREGSQTRMGMKLKTSCLRLMESAYFDSSLKDENYACSILHFQVLQEMSEDLDRALHHLQHGGGPPDGYSGFEHDLEHYAVHGIAKCFASFRRWVYDEARSPGKLRKLVQRMRPNVAAAYNRDGCSALDSRPSHMQVDRPSRLISTTSHNRHLRNLSRALPSTVAHAAQHIATAPLKAFHSKHSSAHLVQHQGSKGSGFGAAARSTEFKEFIRELMDDPEIRACTHGGYVELVKSLHDVYHYTNPADQAYCARLQFDPGAEEPRTHGIRRVDLFKQWVSMCLKALWDRQNTDCWDFVGLVVEVLCEYLYHAAGADLGVADVEVRLARLLQGTATKKAEQFPAEHCLDEFFGAQEELTESNAVKFVLVAVAMRPPGALLVRVLELGVLLLHGGRRKIQDRWKEVLQRNDDTEFFETLRITQTELADSCQQNRELKKKIAEHTLVMVTKEEVDELEQLEKYAEVQQQMKLFNRMMQLLCEGHHKWHQEYLRDQKDNNRSMDVLSMSVEVLNRLCMNDDGNAKIANPKQGEKFAPFDRDMDEDEISVLKTFADVITEMVQGPCFENQHQLVMKSKIVEVIMRVLQARFRRISDGENSPKHEIPEVIRCLKGSLCITLNALYEGQAAGENTLLRQVLKWVQPLVFVLQDRLKLYYEKFLSGPGCHHRFDEPEDQIRLLQQADLSRHYMEPLELMKLILAACLIDEDFKKRMCPGYALIDCAGVSEEEDGLQVHCGEEYTKAYRFFSSLVRSVEISLPSSGKLAVFHFIMPLSCLYIAQQQRDTLLSNVDLTSDEQKIIDFIEGVQGMKDQVLHTQLLSEWESILFRARPFAWFLAQDARNLTMTNFAGLALACLICLTLLVSDPRNKEWQPGELIGLGHAENPFRRMAATDADDSARGPNDRGGTLFGDQAVWQAVLFTLGSLYVVLSVISLVVTAAVCIPALRAASQQPKYFAGCLCTIGSMFSALLCFAGCVATFLWLWPLMPIVLILVLVFLIPESALGYNYTIIAGREVPNGPHRRFAAGFLVTARMLRAVIISDQLFPRVTFLYLALLGVLHDSFYFSLLPLEMVFLVQMMRAVVDAVVRPLKRLSAMIVLMLVILFIFSMENYLSFYDQFHTDECDTMARCFIYTVYRGITHTDGIGDYLGRERHVEIKRVAYDLLYFLFFSILIFNMVAGIIIDTFGAIRDGEEFRENKMKNFCFISGLSRATIDNAALKKGVQQGFKVHVETRQNKWDYLAFLFYIQTRDESELTGTETDVLDLIRRKDQRWLPMGRALFVEDQRHEDGVGHRASADSSAGGAAGPVKASVPLVSGGPGAGPKESAEGFVDSPPNTARR